MGLPIAVTTAREAAECIVDNAMLGRRGYVCAANVHMCMEAADDREFLEVVRNAALVVPDGKPLYWWMKAFGEKYAQQVRGPDLFRVLCGEASKRDVAIGLYGGSPDVVRKLEVFLKLKFPSLHIAVAISPPYRDLTPAEEAQFISQINSSGASILFVGLGCPKQEKWMAKNTKTISPIMIGVGAAFDFYAGTKKSAPDWMKGAGLEWLHRLISEPKRLWKRYLWNNPRYVCRFLYAWLTSKF